MTPVTQAVLEGQRGGGMEASVTPLGYPAFPGTVQQIPPNAQNPQGQVRFIHVPLTFKSVQHLQQAVVQYGRQSAYVKGLLPGLAAEHRLTPYDWELLTRTILEAKALLQFKTWWKDEAEQMARQKQACNVPITAEQPPGSGRYFGVRQQLQYDDASVVQVRLCCLRAWDKVESPRETAKSSMKTFTIS